jgi:carboxylesterase type B
VHGRFEGSLDAMHVNVYSKNINPEKPAPVMVYIHGGCWSSGSGRTDLYGPDYFMQKDVVLVTMNYRLHVFGNNTLHFLIISYNFLLILSNKVS